MATIGEKAMYVRSKNAGPFWVTMDIFAENSENFNIIANSPSLTTQAVAKLYETDEKMVKIFKLENLNVVKISIPRKVPQGSKYERDMHSGQQYIPLLEIEV